MNVPWVNRNVFIGDKQKGDQGVFDKGQLNSVCELQLHLVAVH